MYATDPLIGVEVSGDHDISIGHFDPNRRLEPPIRCAVIHLTFIVGGQKSKFSIENSNIQTK